ncbi:hypothetical protein CVT26_009032 [Gymnopilus dilepis]|uniref:Nephrocystin 3-like N-terminal domain-containing protein n=1 Tax=Gymnopilus dilepis TaxID=231916 RepID=A0A409YBA8_9AGAR|nr:hypothetical protein CVT26_009032 [Gymnopilus dilepis]
MVEKRSKSLVLTQSDSYYGITTGSVLGGSHNYNELNNINTTNNFLGTTGKMFCKYYLTTANGHPRGDQDARTMVCKQRNSRLRRTREAVLDRLMQWAISESPPDGVGLSIFWIYGPAGTGKSAIEHTLALRLAEMEKLLATFFFFRTDQERNSATRFMATIAYQLAIRIPATRPHIEEAIKHDPNIFQKSLDAQAQALIIGPMASLEKNIEYSQCIIIVDGLDECKIEEQELVLKALYKITQQTSFRVSIGSRPEPQIRAMFRQSTLDAVTQPLALDDSLDPDADIRKYLTDVFDVIRHEHPLRSYLPTPDWPSSRNIEHLVSKASGQFIYASTVEKFISSPKHKPHERLDIILGIHSPGRNRPYEALDDLYSAIFTSIEKATLKRALHIVGVLLVPYPDEMPSHEDVCAYCNLHDPSRPRSVGTQSPRFLEMLLHLKPGDVQSWLSDLQSLLVIPGDRDPIRFYHASLPDYLQDRLRSGTFYINPKYSYLRVLWHCTWHLTFASKSFGGGFFGGSHNHNELTNVNTTHNYLGSTGKLLLKCCQNCQRLTYFELPRRIQAASRSVCTQRDSRLGRHIPPGDVPSRNTRSRPRPSDDTPGDNRKSTLWIHGPAGTGKSAIEHTFALKLAQMQRLLATFFFFRTDPERNSAARFITTIAYQLAVHIPPTKPLIEDAIQRDPNIFQKSLEVQAQALIIDPMGSLGKDVEYSQRVIVVDGLDECALEEQELVLKALYTVAQRTAFRISIASRPEPQITAAFKEPARDAVTLRLALDDSLNPDADIKRYLTDVFAAIRLSHPLKSYLPPTDAWPPEGAVDQLVLKASGQFIYASTVEKFVRSPKHKPNERLDVILGIRSAGHTGVHNRPYGALDDLYATIFGSVDKATLKRALRIIGVLLLPYPKEMLSHESKRSDSNCRPVVATRCPTVIELLLHLRPGDVQSWLSELRSLIVVEGDEDPIRFYHASLSDFLLDRRRSGVFYVNPSVSYLNLLVHCGRHIIFPTKKSGGVCKCKCVRTDDDPQPFSQTGTSRSLSKFKFVHALYFLDIVSIDIEVVGFGPPGPSDSMRARTLQRLTHWGSRWVPIDASMVPDGEE